MKNYALKIALILCIVSTYACKKKEDTTSTYEVKIVADGTNYSLYANIRSNGAVAKEYLNKTSLSGSNTFTFTPLSSENINVGYSTTVSVKLKIYVNGTLKNDDSKGVGSGEYIVHQ